ncbi:MAG: HDIG domain-containing protein [Candidatus Aegiribacteria sp.]
MKLRNLFPGILITLVFIGTFCLFFLPERSIIDIELSPGQTFPHDIVAPVDFSLPYSQEDFDRIRESVLSSVPIHLKLDEDVWDPLAERLYPRFLLNTFDSTFARGILGELEDIYREGVFDLGRVREHYGGDRAVIIGADGAEDRQLFDINEIDDVRETLTMRLNRYGLSQDEMENITSVLKPNLLVDDSSREANAQLAVSGLSNIDTTIAAGAVLLRAGQPATARTVNYLERLRTSELEGRQFRHIAGLLLLLLIMTGVALFYVHDIMPETWRAPNRFLLLGVIWVLSLAATGTMWLALKESVGYPYATMVTFGAALTSIFFHRRHAIFMTLVFSLMTGLVHPHPYSVVLIGAISGILTALTVWDVRERSSVPIAIGLAAGGGTGVFLLLKLLDTSLYPAPMTAAVLGLLLVPVIGIGSANALLFMFERLFGVFTVLSIDEVNKTDHPLLRRMREVAPGTWNHSQTVAELAGRAAAAIGAWESLASAGGYFHDIGKMAHPELFIENQRDQDNPHDSMSPWVSAGKIIAHVQDGVEMAVRAKLPKAVIDIISQHHGVSMTRFFYSKAVGEAGDTEDVRTEDFSYPGPRPRTIEAAVVLLADQVASATKNLTSPEEVEKVVTRVVDEKDLEGDLDDCHLTRRNLKTIIKVFSSVLESKFHKRVTDYPEGESGG